MTGEIRPSNDSKVRGFPSQRNTFGLLPGPDGTCPCATIGAGGCMEPKGKSGIPTCYVFPILRLRRNVERVLRHNTELMRTGDRAGRLLALRSEFARFERHNARSGDDSTANYRLHWSGDLFSDDYADDLVAAIREFSGVTFWGYTRNLKLASKFANVANCRLYLSVDDVNFDSAYPLYQDFKNSSIKNISIAYLRKEKPAGLELVPCPSDIGATPHEGSCHRCRQCLRAVPVWFKTK